MNSLKIHKYKHIDINKIKVSDFNLTYENTDILIQSPIFYDYELLNYNSKKYIELKLDETKLSHVKFLMFIDSLEIKLNKYCNHKSIKTQIITNIQNKKSLKVKLSDEVTYFDLNKNEINNLYSKKISLLFKIDFFKIYYSWNAVQILQLN